jgi:nucleoside-diphosphate-sugar epimerase
VRVIDCARAVLAYTGHDATVKPDSTKPTGPLNRVADNSLARELLGWNPKMRFIDGLHKTIDWYFQVKDKASLEPDFDKLLMERSAD